MHSRHIIWGFVGCLLGMSACSPVPGGILPQKKMQAVVTDMQLAEAMINADKSTYHDDVHKLALYESVFRKYNITRAEYDSSLMWYAHNLDRYMQVYNMIAKDVDDRISGLGDVAKTYTSSNLQDSTDIWPRRSYLTFSSQAPFNGTVFRIEPSDAFPSGSTFALKMRVWGITPSMKKKPEIRLCIDQGDTILTVNDKLQRDGFHTTQLKALSSKRVNRVYGYLRLDNSDGNYYKVYADSISLVLYNYKMALQTTDGK